MAAVPGPCYHTFVCFSEMQSLRLLLTPVASQYVCHAKDLNTSIRRQYIKGSLASQLDCLFVCLFVWTYKTPEYSCTGETVVKHRQEQNLLHCIANKELCALYQTLQIMSATQKGIVMYLSCPHSYSAYSHIPFLARMKKFKWILSLQLQKSFQVTYFQ